MPNVNRVDSVTSEAIHYIETCSRAGELQASLALPVERYTELLQKCGGETHN